MKSDRASFARFLKSLPQWRVGDSEARRLRGSGVHLPPSSSPARRAPLCLPLSLGLPLCCSVSASVCLCLIPLPPAGSPLLSVSPWSHRSLSLSLSAICLFFPLLPSAPSSHLSSLCLFCLCPLSLSVSLSVLSEAPLLGQQASFCCRLLSCFSSCHLHHQGAPSKGDKVGLSCGPARRIKGARKAGAGQGSSQQPSHEVTRRRRQSGCSLGPVLLVSPKRRTISGTSFIGLPIFFLFYWLVVMLREVYGGRIFTHMVSMVAGAVLCRELTACGTRLGMFPG